MKSTLKVAELASFIYAFLFFGSFCVTASFYSSFGIDITAYMGISEILLLFLGQPILYLPILVSVILLALTPRAWPQEHKSYKYKYAVIADMNDKIIMSLVLFSLVLLLMWYDLSFHIIMMYLLSTFLIWIVIPSMGNAYLRSFITFIEAIPTGVTLLWQVITKKKKLNTKKTYLGKNIKTKKAIKKTENSGDIFIRRLILKSKLTKTDKDFINLVYPNKAVYCIVTAYIFSIITMCSMNLLRADSLKLKELAPEKSIALTYDESVSLSIPNFAKLIYLGESNSFIFLYDVDESKAIIVKRDNVYVQSVHLNKNPGFFEKHLGIDPMESPYDMLQEERKETSTGDIIN